MTERILITGGCGFIGAAIADHLVKESTSREVVAFDNLSGRGCDYRLNNLEKLGVSTIQGDVRNARDLEEAGRCDVIVCCAAEASVLAGRGDGARRVWETNLVGTANSIECARKWRSRVIFLSSSRVYPIRQLEGLPLELQAERFELPGDAEGVGWSWEGISEDFPLSGRRSLYGATKLASELLLEEFSEEEGLGVAVNRCGVIAGPGQIGGVEQGFVSLWVARHIYGGALAYQGWGGTGMQVRDVLHVRDLCELISAQLVRLQSDDYRVYNVGGGRTNSVSLFELTRICEAATQRSVDVGRSYEPSPLDIRFFVTDTREVRSEISWSPSRSVEKCVEDIAGWLLRERAVLESLF